MPQNRRSSARPIAPATASADAAARPVDAVHGADDRLRAADALLDVTVKLASVHEESAVPDALCEAVQTATGARFTGVVVKRPDGPTFELAAQSGLGEDLVALFASRPMTPDNYSVVAELLAGRATAGSMLASSTGIQDRGVSALATAPILVDGRVWGALGIGVGPDDPFPADSWRDLAIAFAAVAASAIERAEAVAALGRQRDVLTSEVAERTLHLRAAIDQLQLASDAKTAFLANVSHELRTPLTAILGFVDVLASGMDGPLNQAQTDDVRTIQTSSRHLLELIDDLIDVAAIEAGQIQLDIGRVSVGDLVKDAVETLRPLAGEKGISLELEPGDPELVASADAARLREIVLNLLSNALKFTPSRGRIRVSTRSEAAHAGREGMARIDIRDSGIGVADADRERIFETFVRTAGPSYPGTGLGLAISRELARLHGGDLTVVSTVGLGSTFSVHVPLAEGASRRAIASSSRR